MDENFHNNQTAMKLHPSKFAYVQFSLLQRVFFLNLYLPMSLLGDQHHMSNRLEEVWSVRRNVGLGRNINPAPVTTNMYSRHGALPAHHQYLPSGV